MLSTSEAHQLDITASDAERLQREIPVTAENLTDLLRFETVTSKEDAEAVRTLERATIGAHYLRPVKRAVFHPDRYPKLFERLRSDLRSDNFPYIKPLPSHVKLSKQQAGRYAGSLFRNKDFMRDPVTLVPNGKEVLQKTTIVSFVDSTMKSSSIMNYTLMDVRVLNLLCFTLENMTEMIYKNFGPAAA